MSTRSDDDQNAAQDPKKGPAQRSPLVASQLAEVRTRMAARDFAAAERLLTSIVEADPQCLEAWDWLGFTLYGAGRPAEAERACRRALTLRPDHPYALKGLGLCLAAQGQLEAGVASLERAIGLRPEWFDPRWDLVITLIDAGDLPRAEDTLARARRELPQRDLDWARLGEHLRRRATARVPPA